MLRVDLGFQYVTDHEDEDEATRAGSIILEEFRKFTAHLADVLEQAGFPEATVGGYEEDVEDQGD